MDSLNSFFPCPDLVRQHGWKRTWHPAIAGPDDFERTFIKAWNSETKEGLRIEEEGSQQQERAYMELFWTFRYVRKRIKPFSDD